MDDTAAGTTAADLAQGHPPQGYEPTRRWVLDRTAQLSVMRRGVAELTGADPATSLASTANAMVMVASELATNALEHGLPPTEVALSSDGSGWLLDVADHDLEGVPQVAEARAPGEGGWGLVLAHRLADAIGWYVEDGTKHVWATFSH